MAKDMDEFAAAMAGRFSGVLTWPDFDALWSRLRAAPEGWFVYRTSEAPPADPADSAGFAEALDAVAAMLAPARKQSWCGAVYVDDPAAPGLVKVFDPTGMSACGCGPASVPHTVLSRIRPVSLLRERAAAPATKGLFGRFTSRG